LFKFSFNPSNQLSHIRLKNQSLEKKNPSLILFLLEFAKIKRELYGMVGKRR
jgi:hypothetical protein